MAHILFWNANDLQNKLETFQYYYNEERGHGGIDGVSPLKKSGEETPSMISLGDYRWKPHCRGLFQLPMAA